MAYRRRHLYDNCCRIARQAECDRHDDFRVGARPITMDVANPTPTHPSAAQDIVGYLNFAAGNFDPKFFRAVDAAYRALAAEPATQAQLWQRFATWLRGQIERLRGSSPAFASVEQATAVVETVFDRVLPAYRAFHRDLLFHQADDDLFRPFFLARVCQTVLQVEQSGPATPEALIADTIVRLNNFIGHRPVPVLNTERKLQPYEHEWVAPIPMFLPEAGFATGRYAPLLEQALTILRATDVDICDMAWFDLARLGELAIDPRSFDFDHPVNKRPNYHFGQWDPHQIDRHGHYRRFVLQEVTLEAIWTRTQEESNLSREELLFEAGAVLAGTMLMASAVSGDGPGAHDSSTTLSNLLPRIVKCREAFYARLLERTAGSHGDRLRAEAQTLHQPFAGARQHLNQRLAKLRAVQLQHVRLAQLFAQMGYADAARRQAQIVPVASARMLCEINGLMTTIHQMIDRGRLPQAAAAVPEAVQLLHRAIECGALVDPWSILGFQGQFSLFPAMENSVRDHRVDVLTHLLKRLTALLVRLTGEAAAAGEEALHDHLHGILASLAEWWDRFAADDVSGVDPVNGGDAVRSAEQVSEALGAWHAGGKAANDISFWRRHVADFTGPKTYALVVETLLDKRDYTAAMALLMQWLGRFDELPLVEGEFSFHTLAQRWLNEVLAIDEAAAKGGPRRWDLLGKFFDYLEANADDHWNAPRFELKTDAGKKRPPKLSEELVGDDDPSEDDEEANVFGAAYEDVVFRDSTRDGNEGDTLSGDDEATEFELESEGRRIAARLALLDTVAKLWKTVAVGIDPHSDADRERLVAWKQQAATNREGLLRLLDAVEAHPLPVPRGTPSALVEYDRRRQVRDDLLGRIIVTCVDTIDAGRLLSAAVDEVHEDASLPEWEVRFIETVRALRRGDRRTLHDLTPRLRALLNEQPILYVPLSKGGRPREIVAAQSIQSAASLLLETLPKAGFPAEACRLVGVVQHMERHRPTGDGAVTEFDRLFQLAFDACVHTLIDSVEAGAKRPQIEEEAQSADLFEGLQMLTEALLRRWGAHARSLRLSSLEKAADKKRWEQLTTFIRDYGGDLFTPKFMNLGNLRAVLYQRVDDWLQRLLDDEDAEPRFRLLDDLDDKIPRRDAVEMLSIIIETLIENYAEFKDYNSTTTQSDHGEMLYVLLDFLRLRVAYERFAWNLRPVLMVHEVLVRRRKTATAELWRRALTERTQDAADWHLTQLRELNRKYGVRLPTIADRLSERFVRPLAVDRLRALVAPAVEELADDEPHTAFSLLEQELCEFTDHPTGSGLDVPTWLLALEDEARRVQAAVDRRAAKPAALVDRVPGAILTWDEVMDQLRTWDTAG
jgi:hypothetical protein